MTLGRSNLVVPRICLGSAWRIGPEEVLGQNTCEQSAHSHQIRDFTWPAPRAPAD